MNILVTGSEGFLGRNLVENLKNIRDWKNRTRPEIQINEIYEYGRNTSFRQLREWCNKADFVFNLAGVNRPINKSEFQKSNVTFVATLLKALKESGNKCPIMFSSSIQASLVGRFGVSEYGLTKKAGEDLLFEYAKDTGAKVLIYRFPNLAGKWITPNYNSAVGTFCYNIANDLPITVEDPEIELELLFIDDLLEEMYNAIEGNELRCEYPAAGKIIDGKIYDGLTPHWTDDGKYCGVKTTHKVSLGYIVECLNNFSDQPKTLIMPRIAPDSFEKKLYSMFLSYLPAEKMAFDLEMNCDDGGSFTELLKTVDHGQFSVNISKPGVTKGEHWHNGKWEFFMVVSGQGLIQLRKIGSDEVIEFEVSGDKIQAIHMLPGYTHNLINISKTENLVTLIWANEIFDPNKPDTYREYVLKK